MTIYIRIGIFALFLLFLFACSDNDPSSDGTPQGEVEIQSGIPQKISSDITLELIDIKDNRCPVGIVCSSADEVEITFAVHINKKSFEKSFLFYTSKETSADTIESTIININKVLPYKYENDELKLEDYHIILEAESLY